MPKKKTVDQKTIDAVAINMFHAIPLMRKRLLHMDSIQTEHGIPLSHVQVLSMLSNNEAMSVSEISKRLGIAKPNITPLVDRLMEMGLVDRKRDNTDRRVVNVVILPDGMEKLTAIRTSIGYYVQQEAGKLTAAEFKELADALASVTRILSSL